MKFLRTSKRKQEREAKKAAEAAAKANGNATKTMEVPADQMPELAEANPLVIKRRQLLIKQKEAVLRQLDFIEVALEEQTNAVCMAAGIDPTGKLVNWGPEGNYIILTKAPTDDQANGQAQSPEAKTEEQVPVQATAEPVTAAEESHKTESPADLSEDLQKLEEAIKTQ